MARRMQDRLHQQAVQDFVGRTPEIARLLDLVVEQDTPVVFVHGVGGIGKSSLLEVFSAKAQALGAVVIKLDCRAIEPTDEGFFYAISTALRRDSTDLEQVTLRLSQLGERVILALDTYEVFRMIDTWLRQVFIPALHDNVRVVLFGREAPVSAWYTTPGWHGMFQSIELGPLSSVESQELLSRCGVAEMDRQRVTTFTRGHPLALKLAAVTIAEHPGLNLKEVESQHIVSQLIQLYLSDIDDPLTRVALEAASVVRRTTRSLLSAMLPDHAPDDVADYNPYDRLEALPFVNSASDGLMIHDLVQQAIAARLRSADPARYHNYRRSAWHQLRSEYSYGSRGTIWRYTADMVYLIDHPAVHEAFFPSDTHLYAMEQARPDDIEAISAITLRHDGPDMLNMIRHWWQVLPEAFYVARGRHAEVAGFYCMFQVQQLTNSLQFDDPVTRLFWHHLESNPVPDRQSVLFAVRWVAAETGDAASAVQGTLWLDIKRTYMEYPQTRRIYGVFQTKSWIPVFEQLGFRLVDSDLMVGDKHFTAMVNDFGPQLVPGWMAGLVDAQLGITPPVILNVEARELTIGGKGVGLTPLEFELMQYLTQHEGKAVSRDELLNAVWGYDYDGGSNVVDAMVRSLRKKLGAHASSIETVPRIGYKLRWKVD